MAINLGSTAASLGSALGQGIAQPLNQALDMLAQQKLMEMQSAQSLKMQKAQQQQYAQALEPLLGSQTAQFLSVLDPAERKAAMQNLGALMQLGQAPQQQAGMQFLQQEPQAQQKAMQYQPQGSTYDKLLQLAGASKVTDYLGTPAEKLMALQAAQQPQMGGLGFAMPPIAVPVAQQVTPKAFAPKSGQPVTSIPQAQLLQDIFTSPQEKRAQKELVLKQQKAEREVAKSKREELQFLDKVNKVYTNKLKDDAEAAKQNNIRLQRMIKLLEKNNLPDPSLWNFLTKVEESGLKTAGAGAAAGAGLGLFGGPIASAAGGVIGGLIGGLASPIASVAKYSMKYGTPDIEEFEKLSADFVKNAKQFFGSRLTDADLRVYMQTLPSLMQTDSGKKRVIDNLKSMNDIAQVKAKAMRAILKENHGKPPYDLEEQVQERISDDVDKLAQEFIVR